MPKAGSLGFEFYIQIANPVGTAQPGDFWWNGTTLRYRVGPPLENAAWRDITTVVGTA
mgnify:FL=1